MIKDWQSLAQVSGMQHNATLKVSAQGEVISFKFTPYHNDIRILSGHKGGVRFCLFCLADVHQILFSTPANLMLDNLWTKTLFLFSYYDYVSMKKKALLLQVWVLCAELFICLFCF